MGLQRLSVSLFRLKIGVSGPLKDVTGSLFVINKVIS
jgi:hypothetical protein